MKVLVVTPDFPPRPGGIQLLTSRLVEHVIGWDTLVVTPAEEGPNRLPSPSFRLAESPRFARRPATVAAMNVAAIRAARRFDPDLFVAAHTVTGPALAWMELSGVPSLAYVYGRELESRPKLGAFVMKRADAVIAISQYTAEAVYRLGARREKVRVVLPGSDPVAAPPVPEADRPTIVTVARLDHWYKGFDLMLDALPALAAEIPRVVWEVVGDGPLRSEIEKRARDAGIESHVRLLGRVADRERDAALARAHVFSMPSRVDEHGGGGEGFGIVFLEAGRHGLPCVAADSGGAPDAVLDGETGVLVPPDDSEALADALRHLLNDASWAKRLGEAGRRRAEQLSWARMAAEVDTIAREVVGR